MNKYPPSKKLYQPKKLNCTQNTIIPFPHYKPTSKDYNWMKLSFAESRMAYLDISRFLTPLPSPAASAIIRTTTISSPQTMIDTIKSENSTPNRENSTYHSITPQENLNPLFLHNK